MRLGRLLMLSAAPSELSAHFAPSELMAHFAPSELMADLLERLALLLEPAPSVIAPYYHQALPVLLPASSRVAPRPLWPLTPKVVARAHRQVVGNASTKVYHVLFGF